MSKFNVSKYVMDFCQSEENKIIDRVDIADLLILDVYDLCSMVIRKGCNIFLQFDDANSKEYLDTLYARIEITNSILHDIGNMNYVLISKKEATGDEPPRQEVECFSDDFNENVVQMLVKLDILKTSLKLRCEDLNLGHMVTDDTSIFFNKSIDKDRCTNCIDCVTYCPTQAFRATPKKDAIYFTSGKCIGCNLCEQMCKENAISKDSNIDLIAFAFDQSQTKIKFENMSNL